MDSATEDIGLTMRPGAVDVEVVSATWLVVVVVDAAVEDEFEIAVEDAIDNGAEGSTTTAQLVIATMPGIDVSFADRLDIAYMYPPDFSGMSVKVAYCTEVVTVVA
ncbi:hypothetical protein MMC15_005928 [Xylographa vitiligo]|nr:hypothetical protein [Xylographa vitiligo]